MLENYLNILIGNEKKTKSNFFWKKMFEEAALSSQMSRLRLWDGERTYTQGHAGRYEKAKMRMEYIRINDSPLRVMFARVQSDSFSTFLSADGKIGESPTVAFHQ